MNPLLIYLAKVSAGIGVLFLSYKLILAKDTFFQRNRFYLLGCFVVALVAPFIKIVTKTVQIQEIPQIKIPVTKFTDAAENLTVNSGVNFFHILIAIYLTGVLFFTIRFLVAYVITTRIIVKSERSRFYELILAITRKTVSPFSLFKWVVVPENLRNHHDFENIVQHESIHSRQFHSVDLLLTEIMVAFQWFNPFVWMMKSAIAENHEYIVDNTLLENGVDARSYQYSLLSHATVSNGRLAVVNHFNVNLLKKRIRMINKSKSPTWHGLKNGIVLMSMAIVVAFSATFETKVIAQESDDKPIILVNGKISELTLQEIKPDQIQEIITLPNAKEIEKYTNEHKIIGEQAEIEKIYNSKNGVICITLKEKMPILESYEIISDSEDKNKPFKNRIEIKENKVAAIINEDNDDSLNKKMEVVVIKKNGTEKEPLFYVDNRFITKKEFMTIPPNNIKEVIYSAISTSVEKYGEIGKNGIVEVTLNNPKDATEDDNFKNQKKEFDVQKEQTISDESTDYNSHTGIVKNVNPDVSPLFYLDDHFITKEEFMSFKPDEIESIEVFKGDMAIEKFGEKAGDGVIVLKVKKDKQINKQGNILIVPNPATDKAKISVFSEKIGKKLDVKIYNKFGKCLLHLTKDQPAFILSFPGLQAGTYILTVSDGKVTLSNNLIIK